MDKYIMSFDLGTTSNRAIIFNENMDIVSLARRPMTQYFPKPAWVEQDAKEIWSTILGCAIEAMSKINISHKDISCIGLTNQRETTVVWNKKTGNPIFNAIVWQCRRTAKYCNSLKEQGYEEMIKEKTGLVIDAYFSATKIKWILDNVDGAKELADKGDLLFGTVETWIIWKLTNGKVHVTDYTNASRTMLFNIKTLKWDEELLNLFGIPRSMLPEPKPSACVYGKTDPDYMGGEILISGAGGDQQCSMFGQACFEAGDCKNTYGTGAFLLMNTGKDLVYSKNGLVSTIAWGIGDEITYALEGSIFVAGSAVQWLRDNLKIIDTSEDSEYMATKVKDCNGCIVVPAFSGLGAPYWDQNARGVILGLTGGVNKYHIIRATLESVAYLSYDVINAMEEDSHCFIKSFKADGGMSKNNFLMQFQADITGVAVKRQKCIETTAMGAAFFAGLGAGIWKSTDEIKHIYKVDEAFIPGFKENYRKDKLDRWHRAIKRSFDFDF